jgi:dienelactone hydrolase
MSLQPIVYDCGGAKLPAFSPNPRRTGPCRASLVAHDAPGVNDHVKSRAEALAELGYAAFELDLYGIRGSPREEMVVRHTKLVETPGLFLERATAGLRTLAAQPLVDASRLAAVGFCQGGITVLELARAGAPILAAIGFHPGYIRSNGGQDGPIASRVLMMSGTQDPYASRDDFAASRSKWRRRRPT